jgi:hypothetical protein
MFSTLSTFLSPVTNGIFKYLADAAMMASGVLR